MRKIVHPSILVILSVLAASAIGQSEPHPRQALVASATPTTISVIDLSGAPAHNVIVLIDGQPYNAVARPVIDPPVPMPGPTPTPNPGPLPPPVPPPAPDPNPTPTPGPPVTPIDPAIHVYVTYVSASTTTDQDVLTVATSQTLEASLKSSLNAEWTSLDVLNDAKALETRKLTTYVNGTGVPCIVVQDDQGNVYDETGRKIVPSDTVKAHAIPAPKSEQGVIDLVSKLRGK